MPPKSTFVPRIKVPDQFLNITLNRPKLGSIVASKSLPASMRSGFTNCAQDYVDYDTGVLDKKNSTFLPTFE